VTRGIDERNRKWWTLGAVSFALFMIMLDNTIVNVALPSIGRGLRVGVLQLEWVVNAYTLAFAAVMLTGGRLADLYGRRLLFDVGLVVFTLSSLACGLAANAETLIAARGLQGAGAALMMPASLSIISAAFPRQERGTAIGIWAGVAGSALAIGPLLGGVLTEHFGWSAIFFVNVPVGMLAFAASLVLIDETRSTEPGQGLDLPGLLTSGLGLLALVYALIEANRYGWTSPRIVALLAAAAILLGTFVLIERWSARPMLDLALFEDRTFTGANVAALLVSLAMFGIFFFVSLYMQNVLGYSPVHTGLVFLPMSFLVVVSAPLAGKATDVVGPRWPIVLGMTLLAIALTIFSRLGAHADFLQLLPGMLIGGVGTGVAMGPMTTAALSTVPVDEAGVASGVVTTARQVGGALGVALMGAIVAAAETVAPADPRFALQFVDGFQHALEVGAVITVVGAALSAILVRSKPAPTTDVAAERPGVRLRHARRRRTTPIRQAYDYAPVVSDLPDADGRTRRRRSAPGDAEQQE